MSSSSTPGRTHGATELDRLPAGEGQRSRDAHSSDGPLSDGPLSDGQSGIEVVSASRPPNSQGIAQQSADGRRTLHLSLPNGNGPVSSPVTPSTSQNGGNAYDGRPVSRPQGGPTGFAPQTRQPFTPSPPFGPPPSPVGPSLAADATLDQTKKARESGAFIDRALRDRVDEDIAAFLAAFDAALDHDTTESRTELREATDRLLRAGARTRIELERMEARVPLHPRDASPRPSPAFRPR